MAVIEVPYVRDLIDHCEFDTIYHEHLCYFSVTALDHLFRRHGLYLNDVRRLPIHGGSLRLYRREKRSGRRDGPDLLAVEREAGVDRVDYYRDFARGWKGSRPTCSHCCADCAAEGKRIAAYGAAAKGATLINYVGIGTDLVDFVVDRNTHKQGRYMPGQHLPIVGPEAAGGPAGLRAAAALELRRRDPAAAERVRGRRRALHRARSRAEGSRLSVSRPGSNYEHRCSADL